MVLDSRGHIALDSHREQFYLEPILDISRFSLQAHRQAVCQFYVINILAYIIRGPIMLLETVFAGWLGRWSALGRETVETLGTYMAWALGVGIAMFWNFFINRIVTYSDVDQAEQEGDADRD